MLYPNSKKYQELDSHLKNLYLSTRKKSKFLHEEAIFYLPGGDTRTATFFNPYPHYIERGEGAYLYDVDGNKLLDFQNNYTSLIHGHGHKPTMEAVYHQMAKGQAYAAPFQLQTTLAELIVRRFPGIDLVRFANSGTEANMHAIRISRAFTGKPKIVKTEGGYHGTTDVFEASVDPNIKRAGTLDNIKVLPENRGVSENALKDVLVVPFNDIERTEKLIKEKHQEIASVIIEPIMGSAGQIAGTPEYLAFLRRITAEYNILLIFDEVVTGRLTTGGAQQYFGVTPDLTTLGKIIGGGTPIGAFGGKRHIMQMYDPREKKMYHSGTFNGNGISVAAGLATLTAYGVKEAEHVNELGLYMSEKFLETFRKVGLKIQMSGIGSIQNIVFGSQAITNYRDVASTHEKLNELLFLSLLTKGVFNAPRGMFCTSTCMEQGEIDFANRQLENALTEMKDVIAEVAPELISSLL